MSTNNLSFKEFLEDVEKSISYLGGLEDELGVSPEDAVKGGQVASFFKMGDTYNLSPYKVLGFLRDSQGNPTHARVKLQNDASLTTRKRWTTKKGQKNPMRIDDADPDEKTYTIPIANLEDLMSQGMAQGAAQGMGGMGGMGGGLGM
jgi:hypothetical protein